MIKTKRNYILSRLAASPQVIWGVDELPICNYRSKSRNSKTHDYKTNSPSSSSDIYTQKDSTWFSQGNINLNNIFCTEFRLSAKSNIEHRALLLLVFPNTFPSAIVARSMEAPLP